MKLSLPILKDIAVRAFATFISTFATVVGAGLADVTNASALQALALAAAVAGVNAAWRLVIQPKAVEVIVPVPVPVENPPPAPPV